MCTRILASDTGWPEASVTVNSTEQEPSAPLITGIGFLFAASSEACARRVEANSRIEKISVRSSNRPPPPRAALIECPSRTLVVSTAVTSILPLCLRGVQASPVRCSTEWANLETTGDCSTNPRFGREGSGSCFEASLLTQSWPYLAFCSRLQTLAYGFRSRRPISFSLNLHAKAAVLPGEVD